MEMSRRVESSEIRLGVAVGIGTSILAVPLLFEWLLSRCFFEGGCEPHEGLKILGILALAVLLGSLAGWASAKLMAVWNKGN
jgi:hypothetical protein